MKTKRFWRSIFGTVLALALLLGAVPFTRNTARASSNPGTVKLNDSSEILALDEQAPKELDKYPENVYDVKKNQPFLLSEHNELALIVSNGAGERNEVTIFDTFDLDAKSRDEDGNSWVNGINTSYAQKTSSLSNSPYNGVYDIQSVGLDADGTGRKQYIASVGINSNKAITLVVQNAVTGDHYRTQIGENNSASHVWSFSEYDIDNALAITAGDYDGDGKDSVIVYVCANGDNVRLMEFVMGTDHKWYGQDILNFSDVLKETRYRNASHKKYKPVVSLATGDFNGDGRDQLAFSAGFYNTSDDVEVGYVNYECDNLEQFATCVGIGNRTNLGGWIFEDPIWLYDIDDDYTGTSSVRTYALTMMHAGVIAAGDVNNDGVDEIVAAGYVDRTKSDTSDYHASVTLTDGKVSKVSYCSNFSGYSLVSCVIKRSGTGYGKSKLAIIDMCQAHRYTHNEYCNNKDWIFTKLAIACAKTNGDNQAEDVCIDGVIYDFSKSTPKVKHTPTYLTSDMSTSVGNGLFTSVNFVRRLAAGNFNGNDAGREQFIFTFWQKVKGENLYASAIGVLCGVDYDDKTSGGKVTSYGPPKYYGSSFNVSGGLFVPQIGTIYTTDKPAEYCYLIHVMSETSNPINATPVAVDVDDDGVLGRFSKKGYVYTDPEVLAVLQAAPYYAEIDEAGGYDDPCGTSYAISVGYGEGTSETDEVSFEVGIAAEAAAGPLKVSLEAGYSMDWSTTYEKKYSVTKTSKFTAQKKDTVVISRIPQLVYTYDIWDKTTGSWFENGMNVNVPLSPRYYMLSIDGYNEFVDEYNAIVGENSEYALYKIRKGTDLPTGHEGNPDNYWSDFDIVGGEQLSASGYTVGTNGGNAEFAYSVSAEKTESTSISHGFHFGLTVQGGGDYVAAEVWAGGYTNLDYKHSTGQSTTTVNTTESGATVQNISGGNISGLTETQLINGYGFTWYFGKWTRKLAANGLEVPFYGYTIDRLDLKHRALPPTIKTRTVEVAEGYAAFSISDLTSGLSSDLTVTKVSGEEKITYNKSTKSIKIAAGLPDGAYSAKFKVSNGLKKRDKTFTVVLRVCAKPVIKTQPQAAAVAEGQTAAFTVEATGRSLAYQWQYRKSSSDSWTNVSASSGKTASYSLTAAARHNGYQYRCRVKNIAGTTYTKAVTLTICTKPVIGTQPADVFVAAGKTAGFTVEATGGALSYQWYYRASSSGSWTAVSAASGKTAAYSLTAADRHNGYQYRCKVTNAAGTTYTKAVTLTIVTKPVIAAQPKNATVAAGKSAAFTVEATGTKLSYQWYYRKSSADAWTAVSAASGKTASYSLTTAERHNGYQYRCKVTNAAGSVYTKTVTLTVCVKPVISTQPANKTVTSGKTVTFTVKAAGEALTYQWYYRKSSTDSWTKVSASSGATATYSMTAAPRHNGYQYRCKVMNVAGYVYTKTVTLKVN